MNLIICTYPGMVAYSHRVQLHSIRKPNHQVTFSTAESDARVLCGVPTAQLQDLWLLAESYGLRLGDRAKTNKGFINVFRQFSNLSLWFRGFCDSLGHWQLCECKILFLFYLLDLHCIQNNTMDTTISTQSTLHKKIALYIGPIGTNIIIIQFA